MSAKASVLRSSCLRCFSLPLCRRRGSRYKGGPVGNGSVIGTVKDAAGQCCRARRSRCSQPQPR